MGEQAKHTTRRKVIRAGNGINLLEAIRKAEGWTWAEGDSRVGRCNELYVIKADHARNQWVATPREDVGPLGFERFAESCARIFREEGAQAAEYYAANVSRQVPWDSGKLLSEAQQINAAISKAEGR